MRGDKPGWGLKIRFWVERGGRKVLGRGRIELLRLIDRHRSIAEAARQMKMSYRRAWGLVRDMNEAAGEPLVEVATGGSGGGGATLTPGGRKAIEVYSRLAERLDKAGAEYFQSARS
jgi:molybdate transport system regulatory protein